MPSLQQQRKTVPASGYTTQGAASPRHSDSHSSKISSDAQATPLPFASFADKFLIQAKSTWSYVWPFLNFSRNSEYFVATDDRRPHSWTGYHFLAVALLTFLAAITRLIRIDYPHDVVFDEVHFGSYTNNLVKGQFFFDLQPPLMKLFFYGVAKVIGYDGTFHFARIGQDFLSDLGPHYISFRIVAALFGIALVPLSFVFMIRLGASLPISILATCLITFDNSLIISSKFMTQDSAVSFLSLLAIFLYFEARINPRLDFWAGIALGLAISNRYSSFYTTFSFVLAVCCYDVWTLYRRRSLSSLTVSLVKRKALYFFVLPLVVYISCFYVYFQVLSNTGTGDQFFSAEFQASLKGSRFSPLPKDMDTAPWRSVSAVVYLGSNITLRNGAEEVYLHSHAARIPLSHNNGKKVSSNGQQVTGYPEAKDPNNYWTIELAPTKYLAFDDEGNVSNPEIFDKLPCTVTGLIPSQEELDELLADPNDYNLHFKKSVMDGDILRLKHAETGNYLYASEVASPLTLTHMEVIATENDTMAQRYNRTLFKIEFVMNMQKETVKDLSSNLVGFRLQHVASDAYLRNHRQNLPDDWGLSQREINAFKDDHTPSSFWTVEQVHWPKQNGVVEPRASLGDDNTVREPATFFGKFFEFQKLTWLNLKPKAADSALPVHPYSCPPLLWPIFYRGISMWDNFLLKRQIYLIANPIVWWYTTALLLLLGTFVVYYYFGKTSYRAKKSIAAANAASDSTPNDAKREVKKLEEFIKDSFVKKNGFIMAAYLFHFVPYVLQGMYTGFLFVSQYQPALCVAVVLAAAAMEFLFIDLFNTHMMKLESSEKWKSIKRLKTLRMSLAVALALGILIGFIIFAPLTYGLPMTTEDGLLRRWLSSWDFLVTIHPTTSKP